MGKKVETCQPLTRVRLRPQSAHANSGPLLAGPCRGPCWRCFLARLPILAVLLTICLSATYVVERHFSLPSISTLRTDGGSEPTDFGDMRSLYGGHIIGYWKEIRETLGLTPLLDTVTWPLSELAEPSVDFGQQADHPLSGQYMYACPTSPKPARHEESDARLLRLGRFNPQMRQQWSNHNARHRDEASGGDHMDCVTLANTAVSSETSDGTSNGPYLYAELVISADKDSASQKDPPPLNTESLAASFRAIAARELRARAGVGHGSSGNYRMFRHLMG